MKKNMAKKIDLFSNSFEVSGRLMYFKAKEKFAFKNKLTFYNPKPL